LIWIHGAILSNKILRIITGIASLTFLLLSGIILLTDFRNYQRQHSVYPAGVSVSGISLAGLSHNEAINRLESVFSIPVELRYQGARMQFLPPDLGFKVETTLTMVKVDTNLNTSGYWAHLWNKTNQVSLDIPVETSINSAYISSFLINQVVPRYDQSASAPIPIPGSTNFAPGEPGTSLLIDQAVSQISTALVSPTERIVDLPIQEEIALPLDIRNLAIILTQEIQSEEFSGLVEIYIDDLSGDQDLHFAINRYQPVTPDVAFSAASTIKIPIMVSVLARTSEPTPDDVQNLLERMIVFSENPPADKLMQNYLDTTRGPLMVTEDLQKLGYKNTFLAGYFYVGAPILQLFKTPANTRTDVYLDPDVYNQTTAAEIGDLLAQVYTCATTPQADTMLAQVFGTNLSQAECQNILELLSNNKIGLLIEAGLPPQGSVAHKHGWTSELDGLLHSMSDAGIVYTPGGNFALVISIYSPDQLVFYDGNWLFARLSQTIYNAFNIDDQAYWWIE
jgi:beta-lactamase class A